MLPMLTALLDCGKCYTKFTQALGEFCTLFALWSCAVQPGLFPPARSCNLPNLTESDRISPNLTIFTGSDPLKLFPKRHT